MTKAEFRKIKKEKEKIIKKRLSHGVSKGDKVFVSICRYKGMDKQYPQLPCEYIVTKVTDMYFYAGGFKFSTTPALGGVYLNVVESYLPRVSAVVIVEQKEKNQNE